MIDWPKASKEDFELASKIADRAISELSTDTNNKQGLVMEIIAAHVSGCKLKLRPLLYANLGDFLHDVCGINKHLDRETGKLQDCFLPRYAI